MFGIEYSAWKASCDGIQNLNKSLMKSYLQWFPFSRIRSCDWSILKSKSFYDMYIRNGAIVHCSDLYFRDDNYIQKGDGSYRSSILVSPIMFLLTTAIGMTIHENYESVRPDAVSCFYAGSYSNQVFHYKTEYDCFYKEANALRDQYDYFIKLDIKEFFGNINLDILFSMIENNRGIQGSVLLSRNLQVMKEIFRFCGNGKFPMVENSISSSFLSSIVYLDEIDKAIYDFIQRDIIKFSRFKMIRFVDDLYIFFSSSEAKRELDLSYREIHEMFSSYLKPLGLSVNTAKSCFDQVRELPEVLKRSLYDEYVNGLEFDFAELCPRKMIDFIKELKSESIKKHLSSTDYRRIVETTFALDDIECQPDELLNAFVYSDFDNLQSPEIIEACLQLLQNDSFVLSLDPKRLTAIMLKTRSESVIKAFLNSLFIRHRNETWNVNDTSIAINYLIQREFQHTDLLEIIRQRSNKLYSYYKRYCCESFFASFHSAITETIARIAGNDIILWHLYLMHKARSFSGDILSSYAYFKNYFDRVTAIIAFHLKCDTPCKKPNFKKYHKEKALAEFYHNSENSDSIIKRAHHLRNENPLAHSSAGLLEIQRMPTDITESISDLEILLEEKVKAIQV